MLSDRKVQSTLGYIKMAKTGLGTVGNTQSIMRAVHRNENVSVVSV